MYKHLYEFICISAIYVYIRVHLCIASISRGPKSEFFWLSMFKGFRQQSHSTRDEIVTRVFQKKNFDSSKWPHLHTKRAHVPLPLVACMTPFTCVCSFYSVWRQHTADPSWLPHNTDRIIYNYNLTLSGYGIPLPYCRTFVVGALRLQCWQEQQQ